MSNSTTNQRVNASRGGVRKIKTTVNTNEIIQEDGAAGASEVYQSQPLSHKVAGNNSYGSTNKSNHLVQNIWDAQETTSVISSS